jgi:hypothetical protein
MSAAFPITQDLPERVEWWWYETAEEGDLALIEGAGIVLTRTEDGVLWQDGDEPLDRYTLNVALAFLRAFARIATLGS